jgi:hypothetical protein
VHPVGRQHGLRPDQGPPVTRFTSVGAADLDVILDTRRASALRVFTYLQRDAMRFSNAVVGVTLMALACNPATPVPQGLALTHQWSVKAGTSLFVQASLGTAPDGAADALMSVMPTVVHQLGERCRGNVAAATGGVFSLSFALDAGEVVNAASDPPSALAECVIGALPTLAKEHGEVFGKVPSARVALYLEHAPLAQ